MKKVLSCLALIATLVTGAQASGVEEIQRGVVITDSKLINDYRSKLVTRVSTFPSYVKSVAATGYCDNEKDYEILSFKKDGEKTYEYTVAGESGTTTDFYAVIKKIDEMGISCVNRIDGNIAYTYENEKVLQETLFQISNELAIFTEL